MYLFDSVRVKESRFVRLCSIRKKVFSIVTKNCLKNVCSFFMDGHGFSQNWLEISDNCSHQSCWRCRVLQLCWRHEISYQLREKSLTNTKNDHIFFKPFLVTMKNTLFQTLQSLTNLHSSFTSQRQKCIIKI